MKKIFVQIASYRDPQLVPTVLNAIKNASSPQSLKFCIAWQHDKKESIIEISSNPNIKILDIPAKESRGACWARNLIQQNYDQEDYTLALDSHHRFTPGWDKILVSMVDQLQKKGHDKPLLTAYAPSFNPNNSADFAKDPWKLNFDRFTPEGCVFMMPSKIDRWETTHEPIPSRFLSAHLTFTVGSHAIEVQHDPEYYFHGEEISLAVRSFTHGYDLFSPHRLVLWHEYTRKGRTKHWDDHEKWWKLNDATHKRNRILFGMEEGSIDFGRYGFGKARTLRDYEKYAGIHFEKRAVQQQTLDHTPPPNPRYDTDEEWEKSFVNIFKHCIDIDYAQVPLDDYDFWCVAFEDDKGNTLHRKDAKEGEIRQMKKDPDKYCKIWRQFLTETKPSKWVVWPHSKSAGWCERITGKL